MSTATHPDVLEKLVSLCKRRGFIFQSSEIYGGTGSVWDYGPLGVELKKNLKDRWWHSMVQARDDIEGIDAAILMHREVWVASGPVAGFTNNRDVTVPAQQPAQPPARDWLVVDDDDAHRRHGRASLTPSMGNTIVTTVPPPGIPATIIDA